MNKSNIELCANLANEAYTNNLECIENSIMVQNLSTDCEVHIGAKDNIVYIAARGTSSIKDAVHDLQVWRTKCKFLNNTNVHTGFLNQYLSVQSCIHEEIKKHTEENKVKSIVFTGHSLGAAVSTIAALDFKLKNPKKIVKCITFASPRVGCSKFAKVFNEVIDVSHRVVYHRDPVSFAPICLRFRHVNGCIHFKKNSTVLVSEDYFWPMGCLISQHFMKNYVDCITEWCKEDSINLELTD